MPTNPQIPMFQRTRCEALARAVGCHWPISNWSSGNQKENQDRMPYLMPSGESLSSQYPEVS